MVKPTLKVERESPGTQPRARKAAAWWCAVMLCVACSAAQAQDATGLKVPGAEASSEAEMKPYKEVISGTDVTFDMVPIPGGKFVMGSPDGEPGRKPDEGPQVEVHIEPFWMGKHEVTWDEYEIWSFNLDIQRRSILGLKPTVFDKLADAVTRPTAPYTDMTFGMGKERYPAI